MTVAEMEERMSGSEFIHWIAYHELEPFGPRREDLRAELLAVILANSWSKKKFQIGDFLLKDGKGEKSDGWLKTPEAIKAMMMGLVSRSNKPKPSKRTKSAR